MNWMNKLERKFGRYAIPNLMFYVIIMYAVGFVLDMVAPGVYEAYLSLNAAAILRGQIWRIVTFLFQPPDTSLLFVVVTLYLYYMIGRELEYVWGVFRFNLYFFMGVILHVIAAILIYLIFGISFTTMGTYYLNMSLFFAYAAIYPNQQLYLFMIIPIKMKYLALIDGIYFVYTILQAFLPAYGGNIYYGVIFQARALAAFVSLLNFLIFYFSSRNMKRFSPKEVQRRHAYKKQVKEGKAKQMSYNGARHRCSICGRTELDDENLEFRYCSRCNGNFEYCQEHLFTHEHKK